MDNPFSWDYLTSVPGSDEIFGPWSAVFLAICAIGLIAGFLLVSRPQLLWARHLMRASSARRWGSIFIWIFSIGLFFFVVRWLQINPFTFGTRFWLYLTMLVAIIAVVLMLIQIRFESSMIALEHEASQSARVKGIHRRRPPRRSRTRKR